MRGTTRRSDLKCSPGPSRLFCLLCKSFPPLHPSGSRAYRFSALLFLKLHWSAWCISCFLWHLLSFYFSLHIFAPFPVLRLSFFLLVSVSFISDDKTHLSFASGAQVYSPYILIVFLLKCFTFLSFSLNNLRDRKGKENTNSYTTARGEWIGLLCKGPWNNGGGNGELYSVCF